MQKLLRRQPHDQEPHDRPAAAEAHRSADDMRDRLQPVFSPVLGAQYNGAFSRTFYQHLKHKLYLVA